MYPNHLILAPLGKDSSPTARKCDHHHRLLLAKPNAASARGGRHAPWRRPVYQPATSPSPPTIAPPLSRHNPLFPPLLVVAAITCPIRAAACFASAAATAVPCLLCPRPAASAMSVIEGVRCGSCLHDVQASSTTRVKQGSKKRPRCHG